MLCRQNCSCYTTWGHLYEVAGQPQGNERSCPPRARQTAACRIAVCRTQLAQDKQGDCAEAHDAHGPLSLLLAAVYARCVRLAVQDAGSTVSRTELLLPAHQPCQCWPRSEAAPLWRSSSCLRMHTLALVWAHAAVNMYTSDAGRHSLHLLGTGTWRSTLQASQLTLNCMG